MITPNSNAEYLAEAKIETISDHVIFHFRPLGPTDQSRQRLY